MHDGAGAVGDIAQMAEHRADLCLVDGAVETGVAADRFQKVSDVRRVFAPWPLAFANLHALRIVHRPR